MAEQHYLHYKHSTIHYSRFGSGSKVLVCLHGYGNEASDFLFLEKYINRHYTVFAIDFPFHGKTAWKEKLLFTEHDMITIIKQIIGQKTKFSLLGYSMGGRVALYLLNTHAKQLDKLVLLAPDGLNMNFWYRILTRTKAGNYIFKKSMQRPGWVFKLISTADKLKFYNKGILQIAGYYLTNENNRDLLYKRWVTMRKFKPNVNKVIRYSEQLNIPVDILFGSDDYVIPDTHGAKLKGAANITMQTITGGHLLLREQHISHIVKLLSAE